MDNLKKLCRLQHGSCIPENFLEDRYQHCRERLLERYNLDMTYDEWQDINLRIFLDGEGVKWLDTGEGTNTSLIVLEAFGSTILVAFSETAYCMMTVFPRSDVRLLHARNNSYTAKATSAGMLAYRDARRELADRMDDLREDSFGRLVMPKPVMPLADEPKPSNVFAEALADFKPKPVRPILTLASSTPKPVEAPVEVAESKPALDPDVLAVFAALHGQFNDHQTRLDERTTNASAEIAELERRLAVLRNGDEGSAMEREFVEASRALAEQAFAKYQDGTLDSMSAVSLGKLMLAQQVPVVPRAEPEVRVTRNQPAKPAQTMGSGWSSLPEGPDNPYPRKVGRAVCYTLDGVTKALSTWAKDTGVSPQAINFRLARGMTFREAVSTGNKRGRTLDGLPRMARQG
jgi:hypothetical protein